MEPSPLAHIVVVDDDRLLGLAIKDLLHQANYHVTVLLDGSEVSRLLDTVQVDLFLLDLVMTHVDGLAALKEIRERSPKSKVIMLSGYGTEEYVRQAENLGADGFIVKPFGFETLVRRIQSVLSGAAGNPFLQDPIQ